MQLIMEHSIDCDNITVSNDAAGVLFTITIDANNFADSTQDAACGQITDIDADISMNCNDLQI